VSGLRAGSAAVATLAIVASGLMPGTAVTPAVAQVLPPQINPGANENESRRQLEQLEREQQRPQQ
jgi:hypothetical protein